MDDSIRKVKRRAIKIMAAIEKDPEMSVFGGDIDGLRGISSKKRKASEPKFGSFGGRYRTRTCDPLHVKQVL